MFPKRPKVRIQGRKQFFEEPLQRRSLFFLKQATFVGATEEVANFIKRSASGPDEALMIGRGRAPIPLRNVGTNAVGGSDQLVAYCTLGKMIPSVNRLPHEVSQLFSHRIYSEFFERKLRHAWFVDAASALCDQLPISNSQLLPPCSPKS